MSGALRCAQRLACLPSVPSTSRALPVLASQRTLRLSPPLGGEESAKEYGKPVVRLGDADDAAAFLRRLRASERELLWQRLQADRESGESESGGGEITSEQAKSLFWVNCLPFVGFGLLDNLIMILAGEYIDATLGIALGLSTMAAAGLGNIISDVAGVGLAHYVEGMVGKVGISAPALTSEQWESARARRSANLGKILGLVVGCLVGMFPLLFIDHSAEAAAKAKAKEHKD